MSNDSSKMLKEETSREKNTSSKTSSVSENLSQSNKEKSKASAKSEESLDFFSKLNQQLAEVQVKSPTLIDSLDVERDDNKMQPFPMSKLPQPTQSDSPVIRSLAESQTSHKTPKPPQTPKNRSREYGKRRSYRRSGESSFQISDISNMNSSDLADVRTSELISDTEISNNEIFLSGGKNNLKNRMNLSTLTSLSEAS